MRLENGNKKMKSFLKYGMLLAASVTVLGAGAAVFAAEGGASVRSELTNEPIDASLQDIRPMAVIVDNEQIALPHYGTSEGDVVYELMNSTANDRITRLMILIKDWSKITQMGSIRSVRTSNIPLAAEWNAILCHDGGPFYVDEYFARPYAGQHFSGGFSRVDNGKAYEFTEYILAGDLDAKFAQYGFPKTFNEYAPEDKTHFNFAPDGQEVALDAQYSDSILALSVTLPFYHNGSALYYNPQHKVYDYYEYGSLHQDAEDQEALSFKNVILQDCSFDVLDENGYMNYHVVAEGMPGYYLTNGRAIPITWSKTSETDITRYYDMSGNEIMINTGKTYIALVPDDTWGGVAIR